AETATVLTVAAETASGQPTVVKLRGESVQGAAYGHLVIDVEPFAEAGGGVVLDHAGSATYADNVEIVVGDGAKLTLVSIQDWADDSVHLSHHFIRVGRDASVRSVIVTFGGDLVRIYPQVGYAGPNGEVERIRGDCRS